jgi:hypothetical protein
MTTKVYFFYTLQGSQDTCAHSLLASNLIHLLPLSVAPCSVLSFCLCQYGKRRCSLLLEDLTRTPPQPQHTHTHVIHPHLLTHAQITRTHKHTHTQNSLVKGYRTSEGNMLITASALNMLQDFVQAIYTRFHRTASDKTKLFLTCAQKVTSSTHLRFHSNEHVTHFIRPLCTCISCSAQTARKTPVPCRN